MLVQLTVSVTCLAQSFVSVPSGGSHEHMCKALDEAYNCYIYMYMCIHTGLFLARQRTHIAKLCTTHSHCKTIYIRKGIDVCIRNTLCMIQSHIKMHQAVLYHLISVCLSVPAPDVQVLLPGGLLLSLLVNQLALSLHNAICIYGVHCIVLFYAAYV